MTQSTVLLQGTLDLLIMRTIGSVLDRVAEASS
jgi:hypothetical protein